MATEVRIWMATGSKATASICLVQNSETLVTLQMLLRLLKGENIQMHQGLVTLRRIMRLGLPLIGTRSPTLTATGFVPLVTM